MGEEACAPADARRGFADAEPVRGEWFRGGSLPDGSVRVDLLDEIVGAPPDLHRHRPDAVRWWKRPGLLSRPPALYSALAVALGAGALASLLVLAGWHFFTRLD